MRPLLTLIISLLSAGAWAAPPPGHPSTDEAERILQLPDTRAPLVYSGRVVEAINSNNYTYIKLRSRNGDRWIAAPRQNLVPGVLIRYPRGRVFPTFFSRKLKRSFRSIIFVSTIEVVNVGI